MDAFNVGVAVNEILSVSSHEDGERKIIATDDQGVRVRRVPTPTRSITAWFDFSSERIILGVDGEEIAPWYFVYQVIDILVNQMLPSRDSFEIFDLNDTEGLMLERVTWEESLGAWYFQVARSGELGSRHQ
jgi:hypothetical protein